MPLPFTRETLSCVNCQYFGLLSHFTLLSHSLALLHSHTNTYSFSRSHRRLPCNRRSHARAVMDGMHQPQCVKGSAKVEPLDSAGKGGWGRHSRAHFVTSHSNKKVEPCSAKAAEVIVRRWREGSDDATVEHAAKDGLKSSHCSHSLLRCSTSSFILADKVSKFYVSPCR